MRFQTQYLSTTKFSYKQSRIRDVKILMNYKQRSKNGYLSENLIQCLLLCESIQVYLLNTLV